MTRNICNDRFATVEFQRTEKDENGDEIYIWYRIPVNRVGSWRLSTGSDFQARNTKCWMLINSQGKQEL